VGRGEGAGEEMGGSRGGRRTSKFVFYQIMNCSLPYSLSDYRPPSHSPPSLSHTHSPPPSPPLSQMNTSLVHTTGALLLEPMNQLMIDVKMQHKAHIPLTYNTPANKPEM